MPFTLSHPAAVLPFRRYGELSALVIGSLSPDFLYFIPGLAKNNFGHTWAGLLLFCMPAGWISFYLFQHFLKEPLIALTPDSIQRRLYPGPSPASGLAISLSLFIGACSHIVWDEFTHDGTWANRHWSFLRRQIFFGERYDLRGFALLQDLSTVLGLGVVLWFILRWMFQKEATNVRSPSLAGHRVVHRALTASALLLGAAVPGILLAALHPEYWLVNERRQFLEQATTLAVAVTAVELAGLGLWWRYSKSADETSTPSRPQRNVKD